jgi:hypothetical protein
MFIVIKSLSELVEITSLQKLLILRARNLYVIYAIILDTLFNIGTAFAVGKRT